jgi:signal transduction histidine kinase
VVKNNQPTDHIKFAPDILIRLGEELIPNPDQGIIEIVKNAYDADATKCKIELRDTEKSGGSIHISDDGYGMDLGDIRSGWLVLGKSLKSETRNVRTPKGRLRVGDKGLGRLAALRLGEKVILRTRPKSERGVEFSLQIDWSEYKRADLVEEVIITIEEGKTSKSPGTDISILEIDVKFGRREVERLARELLLLTDPFARVEGFRPQLVGSGHPDLERKVLDVGGYLHDRDYHLVAQLDKKGRAAARLLDWKGKTLYEGSHLQIAGSEEPYKTIPAKLEAWIYLVGKGSFSGRKSSLEELRNWLHVFGGIHFYHRGLRVRPYGDPGHDWLDLNLSRSRNPEERPSTNTLTGKIEVEDFFNELQQKTDRLGFIETNQFIELKKFAVDAFEWVAKERLRAAIKRRDENREEAIKEVTRAQVSLEKYIETAVHGPARPVLKKFFNNLKAAADRRERSLQDDLQLYRSLATAGTTSAVFAHESQAPVGRIEALVESIKTRTKTLLGDNYKSIERQLNNLQRSAQSLRNFTKIPIFLLKRDKRRPGPVDVHQVIDNVIGVFTPFFHDYKISVTFQGVSMTPMVMGSVALLEAVITNLLTNTIHAFSIEGASNDTREVIIRTETSSSGLYLKVLDNGLGIKMPIDEIWLPGRTTTPGGTGFGLTIVRDAVNDMEGEIDAVANGELGGAEFIVRLPMTGD